MIAGNLGKFLVDFSLQEGFFFDSFLPKKEKKHQTKTNNKTNKKDNNCY